MIITDMTVLVVDVHGLVRTTISQGLTSQPAIKLVITTQNYAEAEKQTEQLSPDIIWLEMYSGHSDGIAEIRRLKKLSPASRIMAIADEQDEQEAFAAIMAGAQGYRSK
jgi:DNA-binding NarL/FixJ family response regulator